jgi:YHS domain-containing protein
MGKAVGGDAKFSSEVGGQIYYSSSAEAKKMFDKDPEMTISKADASWTRLR